MLYTLASAAVFLVVGCWLFTRRKSESADRSAPTKTLQLIYRVAITLPVTLLYIFVSGEIGEIDLATLVTLGTLSFIVFCAFELLSTKKWKNLLRALPSYGLVLLLTFGFVGIVKASAAHERNFHPAPSDISWVRLVKKTYWSNSGLMDVGEEDITYNDLLMRKIHISDPAVLAVVSDRLTTNKKTNLQNADTEPMLFEIHTTSGRDTYRTITIESGDTTDALTAALLKSPEINEALLALPPADSIKTTQADLAFWPDGTGSDQTADTLAHDKRLSAEAYKRFAQEYQSLSLREQYEVLYQQPDESQETTTLADFNSFSIQVTGRFGLDAYSNLYFTNNLTAKTTEFCTNLILDQLAAVAQNPHGFDSVTSLLLYPTTTLFSHAPETREVTYSEDEDGDSPLMYIESEDAYDDEGNPILSSAQQKELQQGIAIITPAFTRPLDLNAPYYVELSIRSDDDYLMFNLPVTGTQAEALLAIEN
jgi:ABC-2 type transport system permease protein